jgi:hypothetical protein
MVRSDGTRRDDRLGHQGWRGQHRRALLDQTDRRNCMRVVWARALATSSSQRRVGLDGTKRGTGKRAAAGRRFVSLLSGAPGTRALGKPDLFGSGHAVASAAPRVQSIAHGLHLCALVVPPRRTTVLIGR